MVAMAGYCRRVVRLLGAIVSMESEIVIVGGQRCDARRQHKSDPAILVHMNVAGDEEYLEQQAEGREPRDTHARGCRCGGLGGGWLRRSSSQSGSPMTVPVWRA